ncbi:MAG: tyrosinase family protein, partial [Candidatus Tectomicrobia bacterium]|nr:tyrosinase family protein [Candidatus Tectomicrobia bacterium]
MAVRKDANTLTAAERAEFVSAVRAVKAEGIYDQFVLRHANAIMNAIHQAPAFLPWHRRFIFDLELELQRVSGNPNLGIPYWNWPTGGANASMWNDDLLGGDGDAGGVVRTGPFRAGQWSVVNASGLPAGPLMRAFGRSGLPTLSTQAEIDQVMSVIPYDVPPWNRSSNPSFRNQLEGWIGPNLHNRGHVWVGGSMLVMTSPNDPVFYMNHCMVDKVWHDWQVRFPNQGYLPQTGGPFGQN